MKYTVIVIFVACSAFAKIIAFGREVSFSYFLGVSELSDVFLLAVTFPVTIFGFVSNGITSSFIPEYQKIKSEYGREIAEIFSNNIVNFLILMSIAIITCFLLSPEGGLRVFASGFNDDLLGLSKSFLNITIFSIPFIALTNFFAGYMQINNKVLSTSFISVPLNIGLIITVFLFAHSNSFFVLPIGFLVSSVIQFLFLFFQSRKEGYSYSWFFDYKDSFFRVFFSRLWILSLVGSMSQINVLVDRTLATQVVAGGLSLLEYSDKINNLLIGLVITPIGVVFFPWMAKVQDSYSALKELSLKGFKILTAILLPIMAIMFFFSKEIVEMIYLRGAVTEKDVNIISSIVMGYSYGLLAIGYREIMIKMFFSIGDMKTPMYNTFFGLVINLFFNLLFFRMWGLSGLAIATSLSTYITAILLYNAFLKKIANVV